MPGDFSHIDDEKLLTLYYKTLNQEYLGVLLERYTLLLFGVCMKYLKQKDEAEDAVQQVFLKTLSSATHTRIRNIGGWLYQVARNECYSRLREHPVDLVAETLDNAVAEPVGNPKEALAKEEKFRQLEMAIGSLNENQRVCVTLFYLQEKSYKEIAAQLHISLKEVKSHIQNGKRNLRNILSDTFVYPIKGGCHDA